MSLLTRVLHLTTNNLRVSGLVNPVSQPLMVSVPGGLFGSIVRTIIRCHFPRPSERKRIKKHGFFKRMQTPGGQRVLMRRILKGKHVYSH